MTHSIFKQCFSVVQKFEQAICDTKNRLDHVVKNFVMASPFSSDDLDDHNDHNDNFIIGPVIGCPYEITQSDCDIKLDAQTRLAVPVMIQTRQWKNLVALTCVKLHNDSYAHQFIHARSYKDTRPCQVYDIPCLHDQNCQEYQYVCWVHFTSEDSYEIVGTRAAKIPFYRLFTSHLSSLNPCIVSCNGCGRGWKDPVMTAFRAKKYDKHWEQIQNENSALTIHNGDQVYFDCDYHELVQLCIQTFHKQKCDNYREAATIILPLVIARVREEYWKKWTCLTTLCYLLATRFNVAIRDDHEVNNDFCKQNLETNCAQYHVGCIVQDLYERYQETMFCDNEKGKFIRTQRCGYAKAIHIGIQNGLSIIITDNRSFRCAKSNITWFGSDQLQFIQDNIRTSHDHLIVTTSTSPFLPCISFIKLGALFVSDIADSWAYKKEWIQEAIQLFDWICKWKKESSQRNCTIVGGDIHWAQRVHICDSKTMEPLLIYMTSSAITSEPVQGIIAAIARIVYKCGNMTIQSYCEKFKFVIKEQIFARNNYVCIKGINECNQIMQKSFLHLIKE